jgi:hypothetical protein
MRAPCTTNFEGLVHMLVDADLERLRGQLEPAASVAEGS